MPRHRLRCDCGRRSCDIGNHGSARLFGDAIELDLWRCVYCATRRSSTPTLHQNLMHGRKRTEGGCTVEDLPYMDDSRDALKSPLSSRYDPPPIALAVSPTNRKAPFAMFCRESPPWKSPVMFGPNITGTKSGLVYQDHVPTGAFYIGDGMTYIDGISPVLRFVDFSAKRSNSLYGASSTVQPPSIRLLPCIKF